MNGHGMRLTVTNSRGFVPLCECGWYGIVHNVPGPDPTSPTRRKYREEAARDNAEAEHAQHCENVRADIAARDAAALKSHARFMEVSGPIVTRRGRWGEP